MSSAEFFQSQFFKKILSGIQVPSELQIVWVQTVFKSYRQTTLVDRESNPIRYIPLFWVWGWPVSLHPGINLLSAVVFFFLNDVFQKILSGIPSEYQNSFYPDQAQHSVRPDLGQNCLKMVSADDTSKQRAKSPV